MRLVSDNCVLRKMAQVSAVQPTQGMGMGGGMRPQAQPRTEAPGQPSQMAQAPQGRALVDRPMTDAELEQAITRELRKEKRLSRYKSEAFLLGIIAIGLWVVN